MVSYHVVGCSPVIGSDCVSAVRAATMQVDMWLSNQNTWKLAEDMFKYGRAECHSLSQQYFYVYQLDRHL